MCKSRLLVQKARKYNPIWPPSGSIPKLQGKQKPMSYLGIQKTVTNRNELDGQVMSLVPNICDGKKCSEHMCSTRRQATRALSQPQLYFQIMQRYVIFEVVENEITLTGKQWSKQKRNPESPPIQSKARPGDYLLRYSCSDSIKPKPCKPH